MSKRNKASEKRGVPGKGKHDRGLAWNSLMKNDTARYPESKGQKQNPANHPWFYQSGSLQAHHIIPIQCMQKSINWEKIAKTIGYDINHWRNVVILPATPELACQLGVQIHSGPHSAGRYGIRNYVQGVKQRLDDILDDIMDGDLCEDSLSDIVILIDDESEAILRKIETFSCTISANGHYYEAGKSGCRNASVKESEHNINRDKPCAYRHNSENGLGNKHLLTHLFVKNNEPSMVISKTESLEVGK
ncbi:Putative uncharacterized protein [Moritella viscosa]|uniref:AHH domain-containing protein n=1 Tax=Moritella viscosa TaxID=80854 RepID=UPI00090F9FF3|nr:AHH domain-containing protein [Moritella viscosa]SGZ09126.1 Putative uncharacterized protein [Moritella viscosa]